MTNRPRERQPDGPRARDATLVYGANLVAFDAPLVSDIRAPQSGRWWVHTQTAIYFVDLDGCRVTRFPDAENTRRPEDLREGDDDYTVSLLRLDADPIPLVQVISLAEREPMVLVLDVRRDGVLTIRPTTPVRMIIADVVRVGDHPERELPNDGGLTFD